MFRVKISSLRLHPKVTFYQSFDFSNLFNKFYLNNISQYTFWQVKIKIRNFSYWRTLALTKSRNCRNHTFGWNFNSCKILSKQSNIFNNLKNMSTDYLQLNTKVNNNVMLYRYEKPWMYKLSMLFGITSLVGCLAMAYNVYHVLCKDLFHKKVDVKTRLFNNTLPLILIIVGILSGPIIISMIWIISIKSVKYLILRKGSEKATVVTYHPLRGEINITVPVNDISCTVSRSDRKSYVNMKIKNHKLQYMLDKNGHFVNPELFDAIIGIRRF